MQTHPVEKILNDLVIRILKKYPFGEQNLVWRIGELQNENHGSQQLFLDPSVLIDISDNLLRIKFQYIRSSGDYYLYNVSFKADDIHKQLYLDDSTYQYVSQSHYPIPSNLEMANTVLSVLPQKLEEALQKHGLNY